MTLRRVTLMVLLLLAVYPWQSSYSPASEKASVEESGSQETVLRSRTDLVTVDVSIEDSKTGEPIKDLRREDFLAQDNKKSV
jgi:hypothetical protein